MPGDIKYSEDNFLLQIIFFFIDPLHKATFILKMKSKFHLKCKQCDKLKEIKCVVSGSNFGHSSKIFMELFHLYITLPYFFFHLPKTFICTIKGKGPSEFTVYVS